MESVELPLVADDVTCGNVKIEEFLNDEFLVVDDKDAEMEETESNDENFQIIPEKFESCRGKDDSNPPVLFEDFPPLPPVQDIQELEWVSSFIHQNSSISEFLEDETHNFLPEKQKPDPKSDTQPPILPLTVVPNPAKAKRSKLTKIVKKSWSTSTSSSSSLTSSSTSSSSSYSSQLLVLSKLFNRFPTPMQNMKKKRGRKPKSLHQHQPSGRLSGLNERRCTHCGSTKTPQWRAGPSGAKTLCNACGVRYKSGRLLPEYRPACSPSFSSRIHSNSHRKVLEMRRKKTEVDGGEVGFC